jgi:2-C-methyl-D-erythritol 4-phosphate cytidylyltransferase
VPSRDTVKQAAGDPPIVSATLDRATLWLAQTPQVFDRALLLRAHDAAASRATDDAALVEALGHAVRLYEGAYWNIKVTAPEDLVVAEALLRERLT